MISEEFLVVNDLHYAYNSTSLVKMVLMQRHICVL
jgi:hypothetical protein